MTDSPSAAPSGAPFPDRSSAASPPPRRRGLRLLLPLVVVALGALGAYVLATSRPAVPRQETAPPPPLVRVILAQRGEQHLDVASQGTVMPRTESTLVAQVGGEVESVAPAFAPGGFFRRGEVLVEIDDRDYRLAVEQARAAVAQAQVRLELEEAEAAVARREWRDLQGGDAEAPPLVRRAPQLAEARAGLEAARASLTKAQLDQERTRVVAPFAGRVRSKQADVGQVVSPGTPLATVYASDWAEVELPIPTDELAFLELGPGELDGSGPEVTLQGRIAGATAIWHGRVVRTAGAIDPRSRMLSLFARVEDPFRLRSEGTALPMGLFVEAEIAGRRAEGVRLPREALLQDSQVLVVDGEDRLRFRTVEVLRRSGDQVVVGAGLADGERVCVSRLEAPVDGMEVRTVRDDKPDTPAAPGLEERL